MFFFFKDLKTREGLGVCRRGAVFFFQIQFDGESLGSCVGGGLCFFLIQFDVPGGGRCGLLFCFFVFFFQNKFKGRKEGLGCAGGGFIFFKIQFDSIWLEQGCGVFAFSSSIMDGFRGEERR